MQLRERMLEWGLSRKGLLPPLELVSLGPDADVRVPVSRSVPVRPGKAVVLTQTTGRLGSTFYRSVRYADAGA